MTPPHNGREPVVWFNYAYLPASQARVSVMDRGFLFGDGLFETLRAQDGRLLFLDQHLKRLFASGRFLRILPDLEIHWQSVLEALLEKNNLQTGLARVKIVITRGTQSGLGLPRPDTPVLLALAERYLAPSAEAYSMGWDLVSCTLGPSPALAGHKTLSYLYYMAARQEAEDKGGHEALILDGSGAVAETATGSLIARDKKGWWTPASPWQLPGTALAAVLDLLEQDGLSVQRRKADPRMLRGADWAWTANSLIGVMPVRSIDGQAMASLNAEKAGEIRRRMFGGNG